jgi:Alginate export
MKSQRFTLALAICAVCISSAQLRAQYAAPSAGPFRGFANEALWHHDPPITNWDFGGSVRLRYEVKEGFAIPGVAGSADFRAHGADVSNDYLLSRVRFHAGFSQSWFGAYVEGRSSLVASDERFAYPNTPAVGGTVRRQGDGPEANVLDLHQAYLYVGNPAFPLSLKAGRQELSYGEERLVSVNPWNNIGRTFDAIKLRWQIPGIWIDAFTSRIVIPEDGRFDVDNDYDWFSGVYASTTKLPHHIVDAYFFARNASPQAIAAEPGPQETPLPSARDIYTIGFRFKSIRGELGP